MAAEDNPALPSLVAFGKRAATEVMTQADAVEAAQGAALSGHGGTNDGRRPPHSGGFFALAGSVSTTVDYACYTEA